MRRKLKCKSLSERDRSGKATDCLLLVLFLLNSSGNNPYLSGYLNRDAEFSKSLSVLKKKKMEKKRNKQGKDKASLLCPLLTSFSGPGTPRLWLLGPQGHSSCPADGRLPSSPGSHHCLILRLSTVELGSRRRAPFLFSFSMRLALFFFFFHGSAISCNLYHKYEWSWVLL